MHVLVVNCGSSSVKLDLLDPHTGRRTGRARAQRVGSAACTVTVANGEPRPLANADHADVLTALIPEVLGTAQVTVVGHRVVHGGPNFTAPVLIDESVEAGIHALVPLAPLHNPANLAGIRAARAQLPNASHVAVFDTAFHATLPRRAQAYALPAELTARLGLRRYGFHGPSHKWVAQRAADHLREDLQRLRIITCHLGNGASVAAVEYGRSVETSMGMTPLEGLVMGTRSGDVDPGVLLAIMRDQQLDADGLDELLNKRSGLAGLSGVGNDLRDIETRAADGDDRCRVTIQVFAHRVRKYIGAYAAVMGGVDAIVFTGGIGENSALMRHRIAQRLEFLGAQLDEDLNRDVALTDENPIAEVSEGHCRTKLLAIATDEARSIAADSAHLAGGANRVNREATIPVAISARHVHLTREAVEVLFGAGHELTPAKPLSQPGQFASEERVTVVGPKGTIERVRVLGPVRSKCQVEVSTTDEYHLGVDAPVRNSGDVDNSPGVTLVGSAGRLTLEHGLICARRHIHMRPEDAERFGVNDRDVVEVALDSDNRDLIFGDVLVRVSEKYALEMHLDTDEANAAGIRSGQTGALVSTDRCVRLRRRS